MFRRNTQPDKSKSVSSIPEKKPEVKPLTETETVDPKVLRIAKLSAENLAYKNSIFLPKSLQSDAQFIKLTSKKMPQSVCFPVIYDDKIAEQTMGVSSSIRALMGYGLNETVDYELQSAVIAEPIAEINVELQRFYPAPKKLKKLKAEDITKLIAEHFGDYQFTKGQVLLLPYADEDYAGTLEIKVNDIKSVANDFAQKNALTVYQLQADSKMELAVAPTLKDVSLTATSSLPKTFSLDFTKKGVGGHHEQLSQIIREAFLPRAMPIQFANAYGEKHTNKGIVLYGPPGTGKTLIARTIGSFFTKDKVKVVNGPELKDKYVGESQAKLRNVFKDAIEEWQAKGVDSDLHVIIFDEIDAICPARGTRSGSTGVEDDMTTQLLTMLDGVDSPKNIIVMGTTNRKDLLDPALTRPGRLGITIEIALPDEAGRLAILMIHTEELRTNHLLADDVNLAFWAKETANYTGAELEDLIGKARHFAEQDNFDLTSKTDVTFKETIKSEEQLAKVTQDHLVRAFKEIVPAFGVDKKLNQLKKENFVTYDKGLEKAENEFKSAVNALQCNPHMYHLQWLISGETGVGKTDLAMHLAKTSGAKYIRIITADMLLDKSVAQQLDFIDNEFANAAKAENSVIILDELENLLDADADLQGYNNKMRMKLQAMLKSDSDNKRIVIATTSAKDFIRRMKLADLFNESSELKPVLLKLNVASWDLLRALCKPLGYEVENNLIENGNQKLAELCLPIRELVYQIKKFASLPENNNTLKLIEFYQFVAANHPEAVVKPKTKTSELGVFAQHKEDGSEYSPRGLRK